MIAILPNVAVVTQLRMETEANSAGLLFSPLAKKDPNLSRTAFEASTLSRRTLYKTLALLPRPEELYT